MEYFIVPKKSVKESFMREYLEKLSLKNGINSQVVLECICKHLEINVSNVKSKNRARSLVIARSWFCFVSYEILKIDTLSGLGRVINRNHDTVRHNKEIFYSDYNSDKKYRIDFDLFFKKYFSKYTNILKLKIIENGK